MGERPMDLDWQPETWVDALPWLRLQAEPPGSSEFAGSLESRIRNCRRGWGAPSARRRTRFKGLCGFERRSSLPSTSTAGRGVSCSESSRGPACFVDLVLNESNEYRHAMGFKQVGEMLPYSADDFLQIPNTGAGTVHSLITGLIEIATQTDAHGSVRQAGHPRRHSSSLMTQSERRTSR